MKIKSKLLIVLTILLVLFISINAQGICESCNQFFNVYVRDPLNNNGMGVNTDGSIDIRINDGAGNSITSLNGALDIHDSDVHDDLLNHFVHQLTGTNSTLNGTINAGDRIINVVDATGFTVGHYVDIKNGTEHIHHWRYITAVIGNNITIDSPSDYSFPNGSIVNEGLANMNVDGSVIPQIFRITPKSDEILHLLRLILVIEHDSAADDSKFGSIAALTNGVVIRVSRNNGLTFNTLGVWRSNKDIKEDMFDVVYTDKAGGGNFGTAGRWTWKKVGVIAKINQNNNDTFQIVIQDDLTDLIDFQIKIQGHPEE